MTYLYTLPFPAWTVRGAVRLMIAFRYHVASTLTVKRRFVNCTGSGSNHASEDDGSNDQRKRRLKETGKSFEDQLTLFGFCFANDGNVLWTV